MPIKKANELDFSNKKISMLLLGRPGCGKTTLAESAPRPLLIDLEDGVDRVEACYRGEVMVAERNLSEEERYASFVKELTTEDLSAYDTIIIDSLGKFLEMAIPVVIKENSVNAQKDGKTLSLKGYGALSAKVSEFIKTIKALNKNIIFIAHVTEVNDGEVVKTRVNIPGSTKDKIWDDIDLGGYMTFQGKKRVIYFTPTEQYDAKGNHGIVGTYELPELLNQRNGGKFTDNHFLTDLFNVYVNELNSSKENYKNDSVIYEEAMKLVSKISAVANVDELNSVVEEIKVAQHALTSKKELLAHVQKKAEEINAAYDKEAKRYIAKN
jgi:hypothetical protein